MSRELDLVEVVDEAGDATGSATVAQAHTAPGRLHRAFSVVLVDADRRILLQRRAAAKTRFPLRWANSCCGHPAPDQSVTAAAAIRLREELGVTGVALREIGIHQYRATDERTGRVEHEYDHVLIGHVADTLVCAPDPAEVAEVRWMQRSDIERDLTIDPRAYAPWLAGVVALLPV